MKFEIDFLPVGTASKGGDAICFRYWDDDVPQFVGVIDGGTKEAGEAMVNHIKQFYGTETIDVVLSTHCHVDHSRGLTAILENFEVNLLLMHLPWEHSAEILDLFHDNRMTASSLDRRIKDGLSHIHELYEISLREDKQIPVAEPFVGVDTGSAHFKILGPTRSYYQQLLPEFTKTPKAKTLFEMLTRGEEAAKSLIVESFDEESLAEPTQSTTPENNSSVVAMLTLNNKTYLFTADAGVPALQFAIDQYEQMGYTTNSIRGVQIPHHGSKRNVGPTILNRLLGENQVDGKSSGRFAFVSCPPAGLPKHPSQRVINACIRRGAGVYLTGGKALGHREGAEARNGWGPASAMSFSPEVEADEE